MPERMNTLINAPAITDKTRELCQAILAHPGFQAAQEHISAFVADADARAQYQSVLSKGQELRQRHQLDGLISPGELEAFESERNALLANPVVRAFLEAQAELHELRCNIEQHVAMTLELGRLPTPEELESQSCGDGCNCGDH